jgi:hypothetical protein
MSWGVVQRRKHATHTVTANARSRRRWFGGLCLLAAIVMLVAGVTVIETQLSGVTLICYWLGCFVLTALAAGTALIDASRVRAEQRDEQRALLESTLHEIEREKRSRKAAQD